MDQEQLISLSEAASLSDLSAAHLRRLAEHGRLRARKIGRNWVTTAAAVADYLQDEEQRSKDPLKYKRR